MKHPVDMTQRFEPDLHAVHREWAWIGVVTAVLGPALLYLGGGRNFVVLSVLGCIGGVSGFGLYALRNSIRAVQWIKIPSTVVTLARRGNEIQLPWDTIKSVKEQSHYGQYLTIHTRGNKRPYTFLLEGYTTEQITGIMALLQQNQPTTTADETLGR